MRICIDMGHTPTSPGASGYIDELKEDRALGARLIAELERRGHAVTDTTAPDWMAYPDEVDHRVGKANATDAELFVSIHFNAGGGSGTEVLYFAGDDAGRSYASRISSKLASALGLPDRGAKANDWVGVICDTYMTAVLVETCFVDAKADADAYARTSWDAIITAIASGIDGSSGGSEPEPSGWDGPGQEIAGDTRYSTAEAIAAKKGATGTLMAASPDKWPDLASGMWVAGRLNANILYDREDFYLSDGTGGVYLGSDNRYGTNRYTLDFWTKVKGFDSGDTCFVVPGDKFADAAACAWASYNRGIPIVLYEDHKNFYGLIGRFEHVIAIGDTVPKFDGETDRISGASRVEVSVGIAERYAETWGQPMIVTPDVPYDAIASAQWAGNDCVLFAGDAAEDALRRHRGEITDLYWVGGENSIPYDVRHAMAEAAGLE